MSKVWTITRSEPDGNSGIDGQSFAGTEPKGVEAWLDQLAKELKDLRPQAVQRVLIPKSDGKMKPTGEFSYSGPHVVLVSAANYRMKCSRCERDRGCFRVERCFFLASDCQCV